MNAGMLRGMVRLLLTVTFVMFILLVVILSTLPSSTTLPLFTSTNQDDAFVDWNYGIVVDAGSTGSRLFLYKWQSVSSDRLIDVHPALDHYNRAVVKKVTPGLSSFGGNPENATEYMRPLLDYAVQFVPDKKRSGTPIFILATAGMRLLPVSSQEAIMKNLRTNLPTVTPMQVIGDHIRVIEGKWEGIYSWIAVNYILGRFDFNGSYSTRKPTVGMVDMGGASVQIAVELDRGDGLQKDTVETVNLGCKDDEGTFRYHLFVTTFLGYGVNEGLRKYEQLLGDSLLSDNQTNKTYIRDSCLPVNLVKSVERRDGSRFIRKGSGNWDKCVERLTDLLSRNNLNPECEKAKCFLGQVLAPSISLSTIELYGFSEYWFSTEDVLSLGGAYNYTNLASKSRDYCKMRWATILSRLRRKLYPKANEDRLRSQCFKSAWVAAVLHQGFLLDKNFNHFQSVFNVNGQEVQWTLGAVLYHMRYFPLRDEQRRNLLYKRRRGEEAEWGFAYAVLMVAACATLIIACGRWFTGARRLRREPSLWGYLMVPQDEYYFNQYKTQSFP